MLDDKMLLWKLKNGNSDALREIYRKYSDVMFRVAMSLVDSANLAEDVVHDAFVSFAQFVGKLKLRTSLKSYLLACTANRCRSLLQSQSRSRRLEQNTQIDSRVDTPDDRVEAAEISEQVGRVLDELPYEQREVIVLHLFTGLKFREIAGSLNLSINTVQGRYRYGLAKLRSLLETGGTV
jgi:RNA polymerase sigma factor (sigma-70 family)